MTAHDPVAALAGVLSGFALADVLQLLELGARTGALVVDGGALGTGTVRLTGGRVVAVADAARTTSSVDEQIASIARMLDWSAGRWAFHAAEDTGVADAGAGLAITTILVEAARRRDEHARGAPRNSPTRADVPELADEGDVGEGSAFERLTAADLQTLAAIDGLRDATMIAAFARRDAVQVAASLARLRALGVVRAPAAPVRSPA